MRVDEQPQRSEQVQPPRGEMDHAESGRVRCRCLTCGAHVQAVKGLRLYGQCSNCGGIDVSPVDH